MTIMSPGIMAGRRSNRSDAVAEAIAGVPLELFFEQGDDDTIPIYTGLPYTGMRYIPRRLVEGSD